MADGELLPHEKALNLMDVMEILAQNRQSLNDFDIKELIINARDRSVPPEQIEEFLVKEYGINTQDAGIRQQYGLDIAADTTKAFADAAVKERPRTYFEENLDLEEGDLEGLMDSLAAGLLQQTFNELKAAYTPLFQFPKDKDAASEAIRKLQFNCKSSLMKLEDQITERRTPRTIAPIELNKQAELKGSTKEIQAEVQATCTQLLEQLQNLLTEVNTSLTDGANGQIILSKIESAKDQTDVYIDEAESAINSIFTSQSEHLAEVLIFEMLAAGYFGGKTDEEKINGLFGGIKNLRYIQIRGEHLARLQESFKNNVIGSPFPKQSIKPGSERAAICKALKIRVEQ